MSRTVNVLIAFAVLLLLSAPSTVRANLAGQPLIDSLVKALSGAKEDTNKVKILERLSYHCSTGDPELGIKYGEQSLALATRLNWQKGIAAAYNDLGSAYDNKADYPRALDYYLRALKINEAIGNKVGISANLGNIGSVYSGQKSYDKALEYHYKSLALDRELGDLQGTTIDMSSIASVYMHKGVVDSTLKYEYEALAIKRKLELKEGTIISLGNISSAYLLQKKFSSGMRYALEALDSSEALQDKHFIAGYGGNVGLGYLSIATDTTAAGRSDSLVKAGRQANLKSAVYYLKKGIAVSREIGLLDATAMFLKALGQAYELQGDFKSAADAYKEYIGVSDSVYTSDNKIQVANLETKREAELKEKQIAINRLEKNKKRDQQTLFIIGIAALLAVVVAVVRSYRRQKAANEQKAVLLKQKDMLMKEIHHRVKNNLQVISTLLELQLDTIADTDARSAMSESTARVRSISLIHQKLYQEDDVSAIEFSQFTTDLMTQVAKVFKAADQDIRLENNVPEILLDIDTAVPLGLILNELLSNSFKYAFNGAAAGSIAIQLAEEKGGYKMTYHDSGPGLPDDLPLNPTSLGIKMIRSLSKQLGGKYTYDRNTKAFVVTFKDEAGRRQID